MTLKDIINTALLWVFLQEMGLRSYHTIRAQGRDEILGDPLIYYTTMEIVCADGYYVQEHKIVTKDGYVLTVHRIPNGKTRPKVPHSKNHYRKIHLHHHPDFDDCIKESLNETSTGLPIIFVHGLLMASDSWLLQGPGYDLAYLMVDRGYDVWLVNVRGNFYSRKHTTMSPSNPKFWNYSFHEKAMYDLPATIDYVLKLTKRRKVGYIGFSMGTTIFFAMTSSLPEYNDKILGFMGMAPIAFMKKENAGFRRRLLYEIILPVLKELEKKNLHELFPRSMMLLRMGKNFCSKGSQLQDLCYDLITLFLGNNSKLILRNKFHLYLTHIPAGTSLRTLIHYKQIISESPFRQFDYGIEKNMQTYSSPVPPEYRLWNITAPVSLYYSDSDFFYDVKDVEELRKYLPNVVDADQLQKFNHLDYVSSYIAKDFVYYRILSVFQELQDRNLDFEASSQEFLDNQRRGSFARNELNSRK